MLFVLALLLAGCAADVAHEVVAAPSSPGVVVPSEPVPEAKPTSDRPPTPTPSPEPTVAPRAVADAVPEDAQRVTVVNVVDGDTINVEPQEDGLLATNATHTIRLLLVDTPETVHPNEPVACFGREASEFVNDQLLGETVWLEADTADTDRYGRFLRHVWLEDGTNFNLELVRRGYADALLYEPNDRYWDQFSAAAEEAQDSDFGLWSACQSLGAPPAGSGFATTSDRADGPAPACDPSYPDVCIPPPPPDLDCGHIEHRRCAVVGADTNGLDGDDDGVGCECD